MSEKAINTALIKGQIVPFDFVSYGVQDKTIDHENLDYIGKGVFYKVNGYLIGSSKDTFQSHFWKRINQQKETT